MIQIDRITEFGEYLSKVSCGNLTCSHNYEDYGYDDDLGHFATFHDKKNRIDYTVSAINNKLYVFVIDKGLGNSNHKLVFGYNKNEDSVPVDAKNYIMALSEGQVC